jgi:hypothetical protein
MVHDHFGHNQHEALIHQLFHIRQVGTTQYVDHFSSLVDQLAAYEVELNPMSYATRFVDGLRDDIKSIVMIQRASNLECALALVQEEAVESNSKQEVWRYEPSSTRVSYKSAMSVLATNKETRSHEVVEDNR